MTKTITEATGRRSVWPAFLIGVCVGSAILGGVWGVSATVGHAEAVRQAQYSICLASHGVNDLIDAGEVEKAARIAKSCAG